jgi:hypothetical protein
LSLVFIHSGQSTNDICFFPSCPFSVPPKGNTAKYPPSFVSCPPNSTGKSHQSVSTSRLGPLLLTRRLYMNSGNSTVVFLR